MTYKEILSSLPDSSAEFKESSVKLALESDQPMSQTARELGIKPKMLYVWVKKYSGNNDKNSAKEQQLAEIKNLKKELSRIALERDILKKAAAYFAKDAL